MNAGIPALSITSRLQGRLCIRTLVQGYAICGVLHLPKKIAPQEIAPYSLIVAGDMIGLDIAINPDDQLSSFSPRTPDTLSELVAAPIWQDAKMGVATSHTVRFSRIYEDGDTNGFALICATRTNPFESMYTSMFGSDPRDHDNAHHVFIDIKDGHATPAKPPISPDKLKGTSLSQLFDDMPVWPNGKGEMRTLNNLTLHGRDKFLRLDSIREEQLLGIITQPEAAKMRMDLGEIGHGNLDDQQFKQFAAINLLHRCPRQTTKSAADLVQQTNLAGLIASAVHLQRRDGDPHRTPDTPELHTQLRALPGSTWHPFEPAQINPASGILKGFSAERLIEAIPTLINSTHDSSIPIDNAYQQALSYAENCIESGDQHERQNFMRLTHVSPEDFYANHNQIVATIEALQVSNSLAVEPCPEREPDEQSVIQNSPPSASATDHCPI